MPPSAAAVVAPAVAPQASAPVLLDEEAVARADKEMEERANRAKELLSQRYRGLKTQQVGVCRRCSQLAAATAAVVKRVLSIRIGCMVRMRAG
jgi:hypothetical protein